MSPRKHFNQLCPFLSCRFLKDNFFHKLTDPFSESSFICVTFVILFFSDFYPASVWEEGGGNARARRRQAPYSRHAVAFCRRSGTTHMCRLRPGRVVNRPVRSPSPLSPLPPLPLHPSLVSRRCYSSTWPTLWTMVTTAGPPATPPRSTNRPTAAVGGEGEKEAKSRPSFGLLFWRSLEEPLPPAPAPRCLNLGRAVFRPPARPPLPVFDQRRDPILGSL